MLKIKIYELRGRNSVYQAGGKASASSGMLIYTNGSHAFSGANKGSGTPKQSKSISNSTPRKVSPRT